MKYTLNGSMTIIIGEREFWRGAMRAEGDTMDHAYSRFDRPTATEPPPSP